MKTLVDKSSHASLSSLTQESDDNEEIEPRRSKRVRKETDFGKDFFTFLVGDDLSLIKRLSPLRMLYSGKSLSIMN